MSLYDLYLQHGNQGSGFTVLNLLPLQLLAKVPAETLLQRADQFTVPNSTTEPIGDPSLGSCDVVFNMAVHLSNERDLFFKISLTLFIFNVLQELGYFRSLESGEIGDPDFWFFLIGPFSVFSLFFVVSKQLTVIKNCRCLDSNRSSLV